MTDHHDDPRDELASAHLDGLTTRAEARRVESEPELQRRVDALRAARTALRADDVPVDPDRREQAMAAALAAFAEEPTADRRAPEGATDLLAARRAERAARAAATDGPDRAARTRQILGVAAALVVLALSVPVLGSLGSDGDDTATEEAATALADEAAGEADDADGAARDADGTARDADGADAVTEAADDALATEEARSDSAAGTGAAPATTTHPDLGAFAAYTDLEDAVTATLAPSAGGPAAGTSSDTSSETTPVLPATGPLAAAQHTCAMAAADAAAADGATVVLQSSATLEGRPVAVTVTQGPDATRTLTATDVTDGCDLVATSELPPG
jgi:hypothetical protein